MIIIDVKLKPPMLSSKKEFQDHVCLTSGCIVHDVCTSVGVCKRTIFCFFACIPIVHCQYRVYTRQAGRVS